MKGQLGLNKLSKVSLFCIAPFIRLMGGTYLCLASFEKGKGREVKKIVLEILNITVKIVMRFERKSD